MAGYEAVIGLEVHVQIKTASKMFCKCPNHYGAEPNTNVCPVCMGHPGVLPTPNREAIRKTVAAGLMTSCRIPARSKFEQWEDGGFVIWMKRLEEGGFHIPQSADGRIELTSRELAAILSGIKPQRYYKRYSKKS